MEIEHSVLVKYSCGCIGFPPKTTPNDQGKIQSLIIQPCDSDRSDPCPNLMMIYREMEKKTFEVINDLANNHIVRQMNSLIGDGQSFRIIKSLLK